MAISAKYIYHSRIKRPWGTLAGFSAKVDDFKAAVYALMQHYHLDAENISTSKWEVNFLHYTLRRWKLFFNTWRALPFSQIVQAYVSHWLVLLVVVNQHDGCMYPGPNK